MVTEAASVTAPSVNVTVPVGVPAPGATALTKAVTVTVWPNTDGLTVELTVVVEDALVTTWGDAESLPELAPKLLSPPSLAVIVCVPTASDDVVNVAWPDVTDTEAASVTAPSVNVTVPV